MPLGIQQAAWSALAVLNDPVNILLVVLGTLAGMFMGLIPGLGGTITLAILIPLTFGMDPLPAFILLAAANGGTTQGGAITSILLNTPGKASNAATILDGHPMAKQGEGGRAIGVAATASAFGAVFSIAILALSIPILLQIVLLFGPPEIFWLGIWGLTAVSLVVRGNVRAGLVSAGLGIILASHGRNPIATDVRWIYGIPELLAGFNIVAAVIGLFAVAEMMDLLTKGGAVMSPESEVLDASKGRLQGVRDVFIHKWLFLRSALIGLVIGAIPGIGGVTANYVAYFQVALTEKDTESLGSGDVRGVIASESSNDAKSGGAYLPTLGFGIPGSASMAILFGAFLLHGITPGPLLLEDHLDVVYVIVLGALLSNLISSGITLLFAKQFTRVTQVDVRTLAPLVIGISFIASFALNNSMFDVLTALVFGLLGYAMIRADAPRIPLILGMVLAPIIEKNFFRSLMSSDGSYWIFLRSPIAVGLILITLLTLALPFLRNYIRLHELAVRVSKFAK